MRIIIDAMGGDNAPEEIVRGAAETVDLIDHEILLVGDEARIGAALDAIELEFDRSKLPILHASEVIETGESPVKAVRRKKDSSMVKGLEALKNGEGDLFMSAGNSGAIMAGGIFVLGRIEGLERPAICSAYPILETGATSILIDSGANAELRAGNLLEFAVMGSIYAKNALGIENPNVGLVNMGTEPGKGSTMLKDAFGLLTKAKEEGVVPGFLGNVEARDVPLGICDVIVCDGLVGNVILKMTEGVALSISHLIRQKFTEGIIPKVGAVLLNNKLMELKKAFDYQEYGGAPVLGVKGAVVKLHGSADAKGVMKGIARAIPFMENRVVEGIETSMSEILKIEQNG
jgi:glycerol-3-phosphate acyltransferase PlsX